MYYVCFVIYNFGRCLNNSSVWNEKDVGLDMRSMQGRLWLQIILCTTFPAHKWISFASFSNDGCTSVIGSTMYISACVYNNDGVRGSFSYHWKREAICAPLFQPSFYFRNDKEKLVFHTNDINMTLQILSIRGNILTGFMSCAQWCHITS